MNNQTPLAPLSSVESKNQGRARVKIAVFFVLAVHGIGLIALLMAGCRQQQNAGQQPEDMAAAAEKAAPVETTQTNTTPQETAYVPPTVTPSNTVPPAVSEVVPPPPAPAPTVTEYTVVAGDTPAGIAKKLNVKLAALLEANPGLKPTALQINQKLHVPAAAPAASTAAVSPSVASATDAAGAETYKVKSGDVLLTIAKSHGTTVKALREANNLKSDRIVVGQVLKIPAKAASPASSVGTTVGSMAAATPRDSVVSGGPVTR
jgi:LysM repeat protein